jgi:hypothetical protein
MMVGSDYWPTPARWLGFWRSKRLLIWLGKNDYTSCMAAEGSENDPTAIENLEWGLWATLMCLCHTCKSEVDIPHWSNPPWSDDVTAWSKEWAPRIKDLGWSLAPDGFNLLCPKCRHK